MNLTRRAVTALAAAALLGLAGLSGCGGPKGGLEGTYKLMSIEEGGATLEGEALTATGLNVMKVDFVDKGAKCTFTFPEGKTGEGTYEVVENTITVTSDIELKGVIIGNTITFRAPGDLFGQAGIGNVTITYVKAG
ncbi:MAG: hypothetical protein LBR27_04785 [Bifidobacteriaceae bacterium]|jgi:hypothetical protein|nr:hypothetical protein [Bifidobacteriaceae bacterium]